MGTPVPDKSMGVLRALKGVPGVSVGKPSVPTRKLRPVSAPKGFSKVPEGFYGSKGSKPVRRAPVASKRVVAKKPDVKTVKRALKGIPGVSEGPKRKERTGVDNLKNYSSADSPTLSHIPKAFFALTKNVAVQPSEIASKGPVNTPSLKKADAERRKLEAMKLSQPIPNPLKNISVIPKVGEGLGGDRNRTAESRKPADNPKIRKQAVKVKESSRAAKGAVVETAGIPGGLSRAATDIADVAVNMPESLYELGKATVKTIGGDPTDLKAIGSQFLKNDPLALLLQGKVSEAGKKAAEHPGIAGLDLLGGYGALGRGAGAVGRSGALGAKARNYSAVGGIGPGKRPTIKITGNAPGVVRQPEYSKNLITKRLQVASDAKGGPVQSARKVNPKVGVKLESVLSKMGQTPVDRRIKYEVAARQHKANRASADLQLAMLKPFQAERKGVLRKAVRPAAAKDVQDTVAGLVRDVAATKSHNLDLEALAFKKPSLGLKANKHGTPTPEKRMVPFASVDEAKQFSEKLAPEGRSLVPVSMKDVSALQKRVDALSTKGEHGAELAALKGALGNTLKEMKGFTGPVLVDKLVKDQMDAHTKLAEQGGKPASKSIAKLTRLFKYTVLPTSTKWYVSNVGDTYGRGLVNGVRPGDAARGRSALAAIQEHNPDVLTKSGNTIIEGSHYTSVRDVLGPGEHAGQKLGDNFNTPVLGKIWKTYRGGADRAMQFNRYLESKPQYSALGKNVRQDLRDLGYSWREAAFPKGKTMEEWAKTLTPEQIDRHARKIERVHGNWGKLGPGAREIASTYAPFMLWFRASMAFMLRTLPKDHPVLTSILGGAATGTRDKRSSDGLVLGEDGALPLWLQGSVKTGSGLTRFQNMLSPGMLADPGTSLENLVVPQVSGVLKAAAGRDFLNRKLKTDRLTGMGDAAAGALVPFWNVGKQVKKKGVQAFNPFAPVSSDPKGKKGKGGFDWPDKQSGKGGFEWPDKKSKGKDDFDWSTAK